MPLNPFKDDALPLQSNPSISSSIPTVISIKDNIQTLGKRKRVDSTEDTKSEDTKAARRLLAQRKHREVKKNKQQQLEANAGYNREIL